MTNLSEEKKFEQLVQRFYPEGKLLRKWDLEGGISAQVKGLEILQSDDRIERVIFRQHGDVDLKQNPCIAADEFKLLEILKSEGLLVPMPYYLDQSCEIHSTPYIIIEFINGETEFNPIDLNNYILQLVTNLVKIHNVDCSKVDVTFLPKQAEVFADILNKRCINADETLVEDALRDKLKSVLPFLSRNTDVILHGDFWPGNTMWEKK